MLFTKDQIEELLNIIDFHHIFMVGTNIGVSVLSNEDITLLESFGIKLSDFTQDLSPLDRLYYFGKLIGVIKEKQGETIEFTDFKKYISEGQYIPLSKRELFELEIAKRKTYTHLKGLKDRVKQSVEQSILDEEKKLYENNVKEGIVSLVQKRKSVSSIISDMGHKMETWKHDWGRIVETEGNNIFQEGKAMNWLSDGEADVMVYKTVYKLACRHCIKAYLTHGLGSKPRIFKLIELMKNGDNIGKKVADWLPVLGSQHPNCRCDTKRIPKGYIWNEETKRFELPKKFEHKVERKSKIKVIVGNKVFEV